MPPAADFKVEKLSTDALGNPMDIAVAPDLKVYWVERYGDFKMYDPVTKATRLIKHFDVLYDIKDLVRTGKYISDMESGLEGIALDGNFASNHWVYLWYAVPPSRLPAPMVGGKPGTIERLSRFTLTSNNTQLDSASEKIIFQETYFAQCCHYAGDLQWGPDDNLWLTTGDNMVSTLSTDDPFREGAENTDVRRTASNTNDIRGKILRIRPIPFPDTQTPTPGIGTTYTIPEGNMRDYFGKRGFWSAAELQLVRQEIYSMGHRNPFSLAIHPVKLYPAIGEAGWDHTTLGEDEINIIPHPQNNGWPFFNGGNDTKTQDASLSPKQSASAPMNLSKWNTGLQKLPPAVPAAISHRSAAVKMNFLCYATALPWVHYDPALNSKVKFPPYLDGKLLFTSFRGAPIQAATVDDSGRVTRVEQVMPSSFDLSYIMRSVMGPDGAIYIARGMEEYGTAPTQDSRIVKLSYVGSCAPVVATFRATGSRLMRNVPTWLHHLGGDFRLHWPEGASRVQAYRLDGSLAWESRRLGSAEDGGIAAAIPSGLLQLRFYAE